MPFGQANVYYPWTLYMCCPWGASQKVHPASTLGWSLSTQTGSKHKPVSSGNALNVLFFWKPLRIIAIRRVHTPSPTLRFCVWRPRRHNSNTSVVGHVIDTGKSTSRPIMPIQDALVQSSAGVNVSPMSVYGQTAQTVCVEPPPLVDQWGRTSGTSPSVDSRGSNTSRNFPCKGVARKLSA